MVVGRKVVGVCVGQDATRRGLTISDRVVLPGKARAKLPIWLKSSTKGTQWAAVERWFEADAPEIDHSSMSMSLCSGVAVAVAVDSSFRPGGAVEEEGVEERHRFSSLFDGITEGSPHFSLRLFMSHTTEVHLTTCSTCVFSSQSL